MSGSGGNRHLVGPHQASAGAGAGTAQTRVGRVCVLALWAPLARARALRLRTELEAARAAVDAVCVGGTTNLSGGLLQGLQMLCESDEASRERADDAAEGGGHARDAHDAAHVAPVAQLREEGRDRPRLLHRLVQLIPGAAQRRTAGGVP